MPFIKGNPRQRKLAGVFFGPRPMATPGPTVGRRARHLDRGVISVDTWPRRE